MLLCLEWWKAKPSSRASAVKGRCRWRFPSKYRAGYPRSRRGRGARRVHRVSAVELDVESEGERLHPVKGHRLRVAKMTVSKMSPALTRPVPIRRSRPLPARNSSRALGKRQSTHVRHLLFGRDPVVFARGRTPFVGRTRRNLRARQTNELPVEQLRRGDVPPRFWRC